MWNLFDYPEKGIALIRNLKLFVLILAAGACAGAQTPDGASTATKIGSGPTVVTMQNIDPIESPVADVRNNRLWEYGAFGNWGSGVGDRSNFKFFFAGVRMSKVLTPVVHAGIFSGQFEYGGEVIPLWLGFTPPPHSEAYTCSDNGQPVACNLQVGGGTFHGVSITPVIFRWNFLTKSPRIQPWFQAAGGLIYTTHKYPPNFLTTQTVDGQTIKIDGGTSVWNFTPQGGVGLHYFVRPRRSIDLGVNAVHISSASLGDRNPGVNASIQIQVGYTYWK